MSSAEPLWRVKRRCMFGDRCNFLHNNPENAIAQSIPFNYTTPKTVIKPITPPEPPRLTVESPQSVRSPPRSPRTTSLLLALRDVIGDPDDEYTGGNSFATESHNQSGEWSEALPTLVNKTEFSHPVQPEQTSYIVTPRYDVEDDEEEEGNWTAISVYDDEDEVDNSNPPQSLENDDDEQDVLDADTMRVPAQSPGDESEPNVQEEAGEDPEPEADHHQSPRPPTSGLLSPIELSGLNLAPLFRLNDTAYSGTNSFDSGYAENWKPPMPLATTPPRSPSINSTFDLLSSPFGPQSARAISPHLGPFIGRSPKSPFQESVSNQDEIEPSELSLDSPREYYASREIDSSDREVEPVTEDEQETEFGDEATSTGDDESQSEGEDEDSYGHTSIWDSEGNPTAVFIGSSPGPINAEVSDAIRRSSQTPTHFLTSNETQFEDADVSSSSAFPVESNSMSVEEMSVEEIELPTSAHPMEMSRESDEDTAFLAYLLSPAAQANENDTLNSLYDIYSDIEDHPESTPNVLVPPSTSVSPPLAESSPSNSSTPASSLRERVFTPPPPVARKQSGFTDADSPHSLSSPMTSLDSVSRGRASPFSVHDTKSPTPSVSENSGQELEVSRKIPFGFRSKFALGRASKSSLMTHRSSAASIPASTKIRSLESQDSAFSPVNKSPTSAPPRGLKPLRLSTALDSKQGSRSLFHSRMSSSFSKPGIDSQQFGTTNRISTTSSRVSTSKSSSDNLLLSSARSSLLPLRIRNSLLSSNDSSLPPSPRLLRDLGLLDEPQSAPAAPSRQSTNYSRPSSRLSERYFPEEDDEDDENETFTRTDLYGETIRRPVSPAPHTAPIPRTQSTIYPPAFAIDTPKPTLMFAVASDNVEQVRQVLQNGEANPNDCVGPQSALEFALTNDKLANKLDIVKTLLAFGADPSVVKSNKSPEGQNKEGGDISRSASPSENRPRGLLEDLDPATKYYLERADAVHTRRISVLIQRSFFRPLTRVRYELIGQDRALEQLFRVLSMHSRELAVTPMVVMLCGPSGHGKSLLARKFGSLLDVPTHTVNMTTLRSTHDLWQSYSMSPYEEPTTCTLAEFLINNEGKRCVVVLDEIEKTVDQNTLWSLLMPWELGRCSFEAGSRHVDVKNVIWLGTSNIGHDLVFQHAASRKNPEEPMSREEYVALMGLLRPKVSERLGTSLLSRITTVLPFVPFSLEEKKAICSEALHTLGGELARTLSSEKIEAAIDNALASYCADEGARSLSRAISNQLVDII
ncbi:hypothetical protein D9613_002613 [Agrocybe pediades]|uniref:AAA+ ATPase domain-containing protein n=1 Tax=Agrocybe pediades TaxID=84607 RepID=A0A8H4QQR6_9AGAR|nr:hypothetical protein D9613_002613 [Agrocybe pediades]